MDVGGTRKWASVAVLESGLLIERSPLTIAWLLGGYRMPSGGQTYSSELPTSRGLKEIAIGRPQTIRGGGAGAPAQDHLTGHELAVVFAQGTGGRACIPCRRWPSIPNNRR